MRQIQACIPVHHCGLCSQTRLQATPAAPNVRLQAPALALCALRTHQESPPASWPAIGSRRVAGRPPSRQRPRSQPRHASVSGPVHALMVPSWLSAAVYVLTCGLVQWGDREERDAAAPLLAAPSPSRWARCAAAACCGGLLFDLAAGCHCPSSAPNRRTHLHARPQVRAAGAGQGAAAGAAARPGYAARAGARAPLD